MNADGHELSKCQGQPNDADACTAGALQMMLMDGRMRSSAATTPNGACG